MKGKVRIGQVWVNYDGLPRRLEVVQIEGVKAKLKNLKSGKFSWVATQRLLGGEKNCFRLESEAGEVYELGEPKFVGAIPARPLLGVDQEARTK